MISNSTAKSIVIALAIGGVVVAGERLLQKHLPLSDILTRVQQSGLTDVVEADYDDGIWEIEGFRNGAGVEIHVHPVTGKVLSEHPENIEFRPQAGQKTALEIVTALEKSEEERIEEIDWERDHWEVEVKGPKGERKISVDATSGKVVSQ